jgi:hypothetical protein
LIEKWGNIGIDEITVHMAYSYLLERAERISNNSFNVYRKEGRRLFQWGKEQGLISGDSLNPFAEVTKRGMTGVRRLQPRSNTSRKSTWSQTLAKKT